MKKLAYLFVTALWVVSCTPREGSLFSGELKVGVPVEGELQVEVPDTFKLVLGPGMYIYGEANQISVDVVVTLYDSASNIVGRFDGPGRGPEVFYFETEDAGEYLLEVAPFKKQSGSYVLELKMVEPTATDPGKRADQLLTPYTGNNVPGGVVGVMRDGKLIFSKAYGMADLTYGIPFSTTTPSNIGSVSKQFTAFAILLLEQQGKLSLDDDVRKHIPELPDLGEVVTLRNMVNHTNGFREVYNLMPMTGWKGEDQLRREDVIEVLKRQEELQASPGEEYNYNNSAFILLAEIVERTTGEKFPEWMKENVFEPMGMTSTAVRADPLTIIPGASQGYSMDSTGYRKAGDLYASYGAGGIYTTVADFNRWLSNLHDPVIGSSAVVTRLVTPDTLNNGDTMTYAKGIALGEFRGLKTWEHGGADIAHRATLLYFPEINAGVATLSNNASFPSGQIAYGLAEAFFKDQMEAEEEKKEEDAGESTEVTVPEDLLRAYAGEYRFIGIGIVAEYSLEEGVLFATVDEQPTLEMIPSSDSVFTYKGVEATLTFHVNAEGKVTGATHSQGGGQYQLVPVEPYNPGPEVLKAYEGRYFSRELETFYTLQLKDSTLVLKIRNTADIELSPMEEDSFSGDVFFITEMEFTRDAGGRVTGFDVSNGRTKGIRFDRSL